MFRRDLPWGAAAGVISALLIHEPGTMVAVSALAVGLGAVISGLGIRYVKAAFRRDPG
jgi:hypothetical protein